MRTIDIYRGVDLLVTIKPEDSSTQVKTIMGENQLNVSCIDNRIIPFLVNDYCTVFGEKYVLLEMPIVKKVSKYLYEYTLVFMAEGMALARAQFLFLGSDNTLKESDFSLTGNATDFINLIVANGNRISTGWEKGEVIVSDYRTLTFNTENCLQALKRIAEAFSSEFWLEGKKILLTKKQTDTGYKFRHGKGRGLYEITRNNLDNTSIITRIYVYGSEKNLPEDYQSYQRNRLCLPKQLVPCLVSYVTWTVTILGGGMQSITFDWTAPSSPGVTAVTIQYRRAGTNDPLSNNTGSQNSPRVLTPLPIGDYEIYLRTQGSQCNDLVTLPFIVSGTNIVPVLDGNVIPYLEKNTDKYGIIEYTKIFDDIYPTRTGTVTSIDGAEPFKFIDADIDFNVNSYLLPGMAAKVVFNTGQLSGYEFEISNFNNSTKEFTILKNKSERVFEIPSQTMKCGIGDQYILVDMKLPQSYIDAAEDLLLEKALDFLDKISSPQLTYTVVLDPVVVRDQGYSINIGDLVWIIDTELEISRKIRIVSTNRKIVDENEIRIDLSDSVSQGTLANIVTVQSGNSRDISNIERDLQNNSILNNIVIGNLKLQDGSLILETIEGITVPTGYSLLYVNNSTGKVVKLT